MHQLISGVDVQTNGYRSQRWKEREAGKRPERHAVAANVQVEASDRGPGHRHGQEWGESNVFGASGLFNAFQVHTQPRLLAEGGFDSVGKSECWARCIRVRGSLSRFLHLGRGKLLTTVAVRRW